MAGQITCLMITRADPYPRLHCLRAVANAQSKNGRGRAPAEIDAICFLRLARHPRQIIGEKCVERRSLRRKESDQGIVPGLTDSRVQGNGAAVALNAGVAFVTPR